MSWDCKAQRSVLAFRSILIVASCALSALAMLGVASAETPPECGTHDVGDSCDPGRELSPYGAGETAGDTTERLAAGGHGCMPSMRDVYCPSTGGGDTTAGSDGSGLAASTQPVVSAPPPSAPATSGPSGTSPVASAPAGSTSAASTTVASAPAPATGTAAAAAAPAAPAPAGSAPAADPSGEDWAGGDPAGGNAAESPAGNPSQSGQRGGGRNRRAPPPPPRPPSRDEVVAICPDLGDPEIGRNPRRRGLTGLDTWLWAESQESVRAGATIRGYRVRCGLTPQRWTWETGDGASYSADRPGGPHPDNPVTHMYERKADYTLRLTVEWRRETSFGTSILTRTTEEPYRVIEVRSVLTD